MRSLLTENATGRWELILDPYGRPGAENMSLDASLLTESNTTGRAFLRLYRLDPHCLSLGRNEPSAHYDRAAIVRLGPDVDRRPTSRGSACHDDERTYPIVAPIAVFGALREAY